MSSAWYRWEGDTLLLDVLIQPRASKNEIVGPHGDRLKIRLTAPPVDGKANAGLVTFLSEQFSVPRNGVELVQGETDRRKRVRITNPKTLPSDLHRP